MQPRVIIRVDGRRWKQVKTFAKSRPIDRHYICETNGNKATIIFGDGVHRTKVPSGSNVQATYRMGSGKNTEVTLSYRVAFKPTPDETLWVVIRNRRHAMSFNGYHKIPVNRR